MIHDSIEKKDIYIEDLGKENMKKEKNEALKKTQENLPSFFTVGDMPNADDRIWIQLKNESRAGIDIKDINKSTCYHTAKYAIRNLKYQIEQKEKDLDNFYNN